VNGNATNKGGVYMYSEFSNLPPKLVAIAMFHWQSKCEC